MKTQVRTHFRRTKNNKVYVVKRHEREISRFNAGGSNTIVIVPMKRSDGEKDYGVKWQSSHYFNGKKASNPEMTREVARQMRQAATIAEKANRR